MLFRSTGADIVGAAGRTVNVEFARSRGNFFVPAKASGAAESVAWSSRLTDDLHFHRRGHFRMQPQGDFVFAD